MASNEIANGAYLMSDKTIEAINRSLLGTPPQAAASPEAISHLPDLGITSTLTGIRDTLFSLFGNTSAVMVGNFAVSAGIGAYDQYQLRKRFDTEWQEKDRPHTWKRIQEVGRGVQERIQEVGRGAVSAVVDDTRNHMFSVKNLAFNAGLAGGLTALNVIGGVPLAITAGISLPVLYTWKRYCGIGKKLHEYNFDSTDLFRGSENSRSYLEGSVNNESKNHEQMVTILSKYLPGFHESIATPGKTPEDLAKECYQRICEYALVTRECEIPTFFEFDTLFDKIGTTLTIDDSGNISGEEKLQGDIEEIVKKILKLDAHPKNFQGRIFYLNTAVQKWHEERAQNSTARTEQGASETEQNASETEQNASEASEGGEQEQAQTSELVKKINGIKNLEKCIKNFHDQPDDKNFKAFITEVTKVFMVIGLLDDKSISKSQMKNIIKIIKESNTYFSLLNFCSEIGISNKLGDYANRFHKKKKNKYFKTFITEATKVFRSIGLFKYEDISQEQREGIVKIIESLFSLHFFSNHSPNTHETEQNASEASEGGEQEQEQTSELVKKISKQKTRETEQNASEASEGGEQEQEQTSELVTERSEQEITETKQNASGFLEDSEQKQNQILKNIEDFAIKINDINLEECVEKFRKQRDAESFKALLEEIKRIYNLTPNNAELTMIINDIKNNIASS